MSAFNAGPANLRAESSSELTTAKIRDLMENAQKAISKRKQELGLDPNIPKYNIGLPQGLIADPVTAEKARRAAELQAKIAARLNSGILDKFSNNIPTNNTPIVDIKPKEASKNVIFDEHGKTIDKATGEEIKLNQYVPTLKANLRAKRAQQFKESLQTTVQKKTQKVLPFSAHYDPRITVKPIVRQRKHFSFFEPGKFVKLAQRMRTKEQLERLQASVSQAAKKTGIENAAKLATIQPKRAFDETCVPELEWWDAYLLKDNVTSYSAIDQASILGLPVSSVVNEAWITNLVEHPIKMRPPTELSKPPEIPLLLTKKERKKLRRQNRQESQKERQEKVRLGFAAPPEPKVRLANLMRVLGTDAVQDPSKVEAFVRKQMDARKRAHESANAERKLTKEQARYKRIKKIKEDTSHVVHVAIYRVRDLTNPSHKFKVETNANQLFMTGLVALHRDCNVVVVEGGPKQQRRFRRLMLTRIRWQETRARGGGAGAGNPGPNASDKIEPDASVARGDDGQPLCRLVWEGTVNQRAFGKMQYKTCPTELYAREQFKKRDVEHYWDLAYSGAILESTNTAANGDQS